MCWLCVCVCVHAAGFSAGLEMRLWHVSTCLHWPMDIYLHLYWRSRFGGLSLYLQWKYIIFGSQLLSSTRVHWQCLHLFCWHVCTCLTTACLPFSGSITSNIYLLNVSLSVCWHVCTCHMTACGQMCVEMSTAIYWQYLTLFVNSICIALVCIGLLV